jgi:hypothetical protein
MSIIARFVLPIGEDPCREMGKSNDPRISILMVLVKPIMATESAVHKPGPRRMLPFAQAKPFKI